MENVDTLQLLKWVGSLDTNTNAEPPPKHIQTMNKHRKHCNFLPKNAVYAFELQIKHLLQQTGFKDYCSFYTTE